VSPVAKGSIMGFGVHGYTLAVQALAQVLGLAGES
jgi:3-dehydroquinate dehydratase